MGAESGGTSEPSGASEPGGTSKRSRASTNDLDTKLDRVLRVLDQQEKERAWTDRLGRWSAVLALVAFLFGVGSITAVATNLPIPLPFGHRSEITEANAACTAITFSPAYTPKQMHSTLEQLQKLARADAIPAPLVADLGAATQYWHAAYDAAQAENHVKKDSAAGWGYGAQFRQSQAAYLTQLLRYDQDADDYGFDPYDPCRANVRYATIGIDGIPS